MNANTIRNLLEQKAGKLPKMRSHEELQSLAEFLEQPDTADYLQHCVPDDVIAASGVRLLPINAIEQEMAEGAAPGSFIRPFGYLIVATSIGGNAVCIHSATGKVFWADHDSFSDDSISYKDRASEDWKYLHEYTPANVEKALVPLSNNIESFFIDLLSDRLTEKLDALD